MFIVAAAGALDDICLRIIFYYHYVTNQTIFIICYHPIYVVL